MERNYKAIVIVCGSIGALKPEGMDMPEGTDILTHAHAWHANPLVDLVAVVDTDAEKARQASKKWGSEWYTEPSKAMAPWHPDIVSVCVPTEVHQHTVQGVLSYCNPAPKIIIVEKPCGSTTKECQTITKLCRTARVLLVVNYQRRTLELLNRLRDSITLGLEKPQMARVVYGRGLKRDGCHGIDLINWILGDVVSVHTTEMITDRDGTGKDPSFGAVMMTRHCPAVYLVPTESRHYGCFDFEVWTDKGVHHFFDWGSKYLFHSAAEEQTFGKGYKSLSMSAPYYSQDTQLRSALLEMSRRVVAYLVRGECQTSSILCTGEEAIEVHRTIARIRGEDE